MITFTRLKGNIPLAVKREDIRRALYRTLDTTWLIFDRVRNGNMSEHKVAVAGDMAYVVSLIGPL
jgi:hypothetical protein